MNAETTTLAQQTLEHAKILIQEMDAAGFVYDKPEFVRMVYGIKKNHDLGHEGGVIGDLDTVITQLEHYEHALHTFQKEQEMVGMQGDMKNTWSELYTDTITPKTLTKQMHALGFWDRATHVKLLEIAVFFALILGGSKMILQGGTQGMRWDMIVLAVIGGFVWGVRCVVR